MALGLAALTGWLFLADYYLWRVRHGDAASRQHLVGMGPRVLPALYEEASNLDDSSTHSDALVEVMTGIRTTLIADEIGDSSPSAIRAAVHPVDDAMAEALATAYRHPHGVEGDVILDIVSLDFSMYVRFFCDVFESASPADQAVLLQALALKVAPVDDARPPETRAEMQRQFREYALPILLDHLEIEVDNGYLVAQALAPLYAIDRENIVVLVWRLLAGSSRHIHPLLEVLDANHLDELISLYPTLTLDRQYQVAYNMTKTELGPRVLCRMLPDTIQPPAQLLILDSLANAADTELGVCVGPIVTTMDKPVDPIGLPFDREHFQARVSEVLLRACRLGPRFAAEIELLRAEVVHEDVGEAIDAILSTCAATAEASDTAQAR